LYKSQYQGRNRSRITKGRGVLEGTKEMTGTKETKTAKEKSGATKDERLSQLRGSL
jgi:hypothetical protein